MLRCGHEIESKQEKIHYQASPERAGGYGKSELEIRNSNRSIRAAKAC